MLLDWLAAALLSDVFLIVLRLVSVEVLWFALPAVGCALLLPAIGFALLGSFHHCSGSSMFFSCGPRTLVAFLHSFHHWLVGFSFWMWFSPTGSLAVVPSVLLLQSHFVVVYDSVVRFWPLPTPLLSIVPLRDWWFAVGALDPRESCSQQRVLLSVRSGLRGSLHLLLVGGLQYHCAVLWAVSTLETKAFIAASCHGVVYWVVRHRWACFSIVWFLWLKIFVYLVSVRRYFPSRVLMTFLSLWHARGLQFPRFLNFRCAQSVMRLLRSADIRLFWSGFVPRCRRACLDSDMSGGAFLLSSTLVLEARLAPIPRLPIFAVRSFSRSLSPSLMLVCCRFEICNIVPAPTPRSGVGRFWTLLRVIVCVICTYLGTCGVTTVFCATLINSWNSSTSHWQEVSRVSAFHLGHLL